MPINTVSNDEVELVQTDCFSLTEKKKKLHEKTNSIIFDDLRFFYCGKLLNEQF